MNCSQCNNKIVYGKYCNDHFIDFFERKVKDTIKRFNLLKKTDNIGVAVSGGKDSMSLLHLLHKFGYNVTALAVDEGISGYRDKSLAHLKKYCEGNLIKLRLVSFKSWYGKSLDEILVKKFRPCTVCGVFRRQLLNNMAKDFDVLATGHNLDDEGQAIVMNLLKANITLLQRLGPISGVVKSQKFTKRVKPFYLCREKEVMVYAFLNKLTDVFVECPNVSQAYRLRIRDILNDIEYIQPNTKNNLVKWFLKYKTNIVAGDNKIQFCQICANPSPRKICNACRYIAKINT